MVPSDVAVVDKDAASVSLIDVGVSVNKHILRREAYQI